MKRCRLPERSSTEHFGGTRIRPSKERDIRLVQMIHLESDIHPTKCLNFNKRWARNIRQAADVDDSIGLGKAQIEHRPQRLASGHQAGVG